jgi:hypothetical protein
LGTCTVCHKPDSCMFVAEKYHALLENPVAVYKFVI